MGEVEVSEPPACPRLSSWQGFIHGRKPASYFHCREKRTRRVGVLVPSAQVISKGKLVPAKAQLVPIPSPLACTAPEKLASVPARTKCWVAPRSVLSLQLS